MKRFYILLVAMASVVSLSGMVSDDAMLGYEYSGMMNGWTIHPAYGSISELAYASGKIYALSEGSICSFDPDDEELRTLTTLHGLSSYGIGHILSDGHNRLLLAYTDGCFDIIRADGSIGTINDLKNKQLSGVSKLAKDIFIEGGTAYLACDFGVLLLNMQKEEISEWWQPTEDGMAMLEHLTQRGDSLYAASSHTLYVGHMADNLSDYGRWHAYPLATRDDIVFPSHFSGHTNYKDCDYYPSSDEGLVRICGGVRSTYMPDGPAVNNPYRITFSGDKMIMVPGSRWATEAARPAQVMIREDGRWTNIRYSQIDNASPTPYVFDFTRAAIDPRDPNHFYVTSYGEGLYEFYGTDIQHIYNADNSPLISAAEGNPLYCRTDGVVFDQEGNLWFANSGNTHALHMIDAHGGWHEFSIREQVMRTPGDVVVDALRPNYKWIASCREPAGIGLLDDNGTPTLPGDDRTVFRSTFVDGNGKTITPTEIHSIAQDRNGAIWVGTKEGLLMIPSTTDFFTSNRCTRIIIGRTDGSELGDYMLGTEQINGIAVDGGNRLWIATATSGVYLMDIHLFDFDTETVRHFTTTNSPLPSDNILSVAIDPLDGEVWIGSDAGLVSFRSDASEPAEDYASAYVYPNPVRPDFDGMLTVTGLMEDSSVKIANEAGYVVYSGTAHGGTATWDMQDLAGRRVRPGVYLIYCNSKAGADPSGKKALKVLIM